VLLVQTALFAPEGEPPLIVGLVRRLGSPPHVFLHERLAGGVGGGVAADLLGPLPLALVRDQAQQPPGGHVGGVDERRQSEVLDPLGRESVRLAPEGELDLGVGVAADFGFGLLVRLQVGWSSRWISGGNGCREHDAGEQNRGDHRRASLE
jgi:hypothetical protein